MQKNARLESVIRMSNKDEVPEFVTVLIGAKSCTLSNAIGKAEIESLKGMLFEKGVGRWKMQAIVKANKSEITDMFSRLLSVMNRAEVVKVLIGAKNRGIGRITEVNAGEDHFKITVTGLELFTLTKMDKVIKRLTGNNDYF